MDKCTVREKCFSYAELKAIKGFDNGESLIDLRDSTLEFSFGPGSEKMLPYVGKAMLVRKGVHERLLLAQQQLQISYPEYRLKIYYAYRHPEVQKGNFDLFFSASREKFPDYTEEELKEYVHHYMAIPDVGGHPVGAAVDITIETQNGELDMGASMADFSDMEKVHTFSKTINDVQLGNRLLLRTVLMEQGFAPYDFEWWHFSYGDREWACYYGYDQTLYEALDYRNQVS